MKKLLLLTALCAAPLLSQAQDTDISSAETAYNKWSIELGGGLQKPSGSFADGYFTKGASPFQGSLGVRYMMNEKFGVRTTFGYNSLTEDDGSLPFEATYIRGTLEGVVNVGNVLGFSDWTNTFGLLFHGGAGYSNLNHKTPAGNDESDHLMNVAAGLTPQIRLSDRVAFNVDITLLGNVGFDKTWDGTQAIQRNSRQIDDGLLYNVSAGFNIYLGKNAKHADWYSEKNVVKSKLEELEERLAKVETDMIDSDMDGVPDYLDREPNTPSGVAVDTKGYATDKNENGIPDELEPSLDNRYVNESDYIVGGGKGLGVKELIENGYVNVYFKFNSTQPETYSLSAINFLKTYMKENPSAQAELIGFADEIGNEAYNVQLSEKRAKRVYDILIASGVDANRLSFTGNGEDASVDKSSSAARQLVRRVTFRLK